MEKEEIFCKLKNTLQTVLQRDNNISEDTLLKEIEGWDSLEHMTIISQIETEFDIEFGLGDIVLVKTVKDLVEAIDKRVNA